MSNLYINEKGLVQLKQEKLVVNREESKKMTGFATIDKPWMKWHDQSKNTPTPIVNFYDYFMETTKNYPDDTILLDYLGKKGYTRKDIEQEVMKHIKMFTNFGVKKGDRISFMMLNVPEVIFMFLALNKLGAVANLIKFDESPERINFMLNLQNSKYFFISDVSQIVSNVEKVTKLDNKLQKVITIPLMESIEPSISNFNHDSKFLDYATYKKENLKETEVNLVQGGENDLALIVYSGGSTGEAKGIDLSNKNLVAMAHGLKNSNYGFNYGKSSMNILPPAIAYYLNATCGLMICGVKVSLIPSFKIEEYANLVDNIKPNIIFAGPILLRNLANSDIKDLSYLTNPASGGDKYLETEEMEDNKKLHAKGAGAIQQGYGSSEVTAVATCNPFNRTKVGSIGIPMINVDIAIFEYQSDKEIKYGEGKEGEICISGDTVMRGYTDNQQATDFVLKKHRDGKIWAHTDDFGIMDSEGYIFHRGRAKRMLTRSGAKLWLPDLEDEIQKLGLTSDCCAVKLSDDVEREVPVAHIVLKNDDNAFDIIEQIDTYLKTNCPPYFLPKYYVIKEALPYSEANKKKDFKTLEAEPILDSDQFTITGKIIKPKQKVNILKKN